MHAQAYLQYVLALLFVLALIGVAALAARRLGFARAVPTAGRRRRLAIVEALPLDARRRLVLVRRDGVEHLVILGHTSEVVVERTIVAPSPDAFATALREQLPPQPREAAA